jgi:hypothetical protein
MASPSTNPVPGPAHYLWFPHTVQEPSSMSNSPRPDLIPDYTRFSRRARQISPEPAPAPLHDQRTTRGPGLVSNARPLKRTASQRPPAPVPKHARSKKARKLEPDVTLSIPRAAVPPKINPMPVTTQPGSDHTARAIAYLETLTHIPEAAMQAAVQSDPEKFRASVLVLLQLVKSREPPPPALPVRLPGIQNLGLPAPAPQQQVGIPLASDQRVQLGPDRATDGTGISDVRAVPNALQISTAPGRSSTSLTANVPDVRLPMSIPP